jgi:hypothetical protein
MKIKPLPVSQQDATANIAECSTVMSAWHSLEADTQEIMLNSKPEMTYYIQYCKTVMDIVESIGETKCKK